MKVSVPRLRRWPVGPQSFADITSKQVLDQGYIVNPATGEESFEVQFAVNLTADETEAVQLRLSTATGVEEQLQARAWEATQNLLAYENAATPTNATTVATVKLLCKVVRALIRLQLRRLDTIGDPATTSTVTTKAAEAQTKGR
jgi:hypothetical protein